MMREFPESSGEHRIDPLPILRGAGVVQRERNVVAVRMAETFLSGSFMDGKAHPDDIVRIRGILRRFLQRKPGVPLSLPEAAGGATRKIPDELVRRMRAMDEENERRKQKGKQAIDARQKKDKQRRRGFLP